MSEDLFAKLDNVFEQHDARKKAAELAAQERKTETEQRLENFNEARISVFRPAMEEVGEYLKEKGHNYKIDTDNGESQKHKEVFIKFTMIPKGNHRSIDPHYKFPYFEIQASTTSDKVFFLRSTMLGTGGGISGGAGSAELREVNSRFLKQRLVDLIAEVFSR